MKTLTNVELSDLLPDSISKDTEVQQCVKALDPELHNLSKHTKTPLIVQRIDELTSDQLDHLAASCNMTTWRQTWPIDLKRQVARALRMQKAKMGTLFAVKQVLESIGSAVRIKEWWEFTPKQTPHTFEIIATLSNVEGTLSAEMQEDFFSLLDSAKALRSHYTFTLSLSKEAHLGITPAFKQIVSARIRTDQQPKTVSLNVTTVARPVTFRHFS